jgi:hypothetical protein
VQKRHSSRLKFADEVTRRWGQRVPRKSSATEFLLLADPVAAGLPLLRREAGPTPDDYHELPEALYRLASEAKSDTDRLACLDLARIWLEAAPRQDEMIPEQIADTQKLERAGKLKPETPQSKIRLGWRQRVSGFFR